MDQLQILLHNITTLQYHPTDAHMSTSSLIPRHSGALLYEIAFKQIPTGLAKDIIALLSVLLFVSWIAVILRLLTRFYLVKIWWDDWFMLFTMVVDLLKTKVAPLTVHFRWCLRLTALWCLPLSSSVTIKAFC